MKTEKKMTMQTHYRITRQQGAALIVSLLIMSVMSILGINAVKKNVVQERMANSYRFGIESLNNAESGVEDALAQINANDLDDDGYTNELDPNGDGDVGDRFTMLLDDQANGVRYAVVMTDDDDGDGNPAVDSNDIVLLFAQGTGSNGTVRTVEIAIGRAAGGTWSSTKAILTNESLEISGNPNLKGTLTDIHSNKDVTLSGSTNTNGVVSASGSVSGSPGGGGSTASGAGKVHIPDAKPSDFEQYVDYVFESNGRIYDGDGNFVANADGNEYKGWKFGGDKWTVEKENPSELLGGDLYFKGEYGNVSFGKSPGSNGNKYYVSILADGYLEISGNPYFANYKDPNDPEGFQNLLFMTGTDLKINGNYNSDQKLQGILYAREQIDISGNPNIHGSIIAAGLANKGDMAKDGNHISGNPNITYDGLASPFLQPGLADVTRLYWRQLPLAAGAGIFQGIQ